MVDCPSMADPKDVAGTKVVRKEFTKRKVDTSLADIRVMHGVAYVRGTLQPVRGAGIVDIKHEVEHIARIIRTRPEIRDVVIDCTYRM